MSLEALGIYKPAGAHNPQRPAVPRPRRGRPGQGAVRRLAHAHGAGRRAVHGARPAAAGRAHEPLGSRGRHLARALPGEVRQADDRGVPRPQLPERRDHRHRVPDEPEAHVLQGRLQHVRTHDEGEPAPAAQGLRRPADEDPAHAGSRVKALDKILRNELIDEPEDEHAFRMHFPPPEPLGRPIIAVEDVGFRYTPESPVLFKDVHLGVDMSSRIGILGVNGSGKSTLINIMIGKLRAKEGSVTMNPRLRVATFTQHHVDSLDLSKSAVQNMQEMFPGHEPDEFRSHLGRFNLSGELAIKPTRTLSGGQKSRVGFALMTWRLPHVVVLDEPTNHLDMETIDALIDALREYKGGVVIVSHDQHFVTSVCEELWVVGDQKVARFRGTMGEYKNRVLAKK
ncbi:hypothetical protein ON010_g900 [Phytophthora cinnamomi]|nr:hypothetical protein ON010_g900 [Phytophthora cinnamomi]